MTDIRRKRCFIAALAVVFLAVLALNVLTPRVCDDYMYCFSFATGERLAGVADIAPSLVAHGQVMNGRYAPHFVVHLFNLLPAVAFDVANSLVYVALALGLYLLVRADKRHDVTLLLAVVGALFLLPPVFGQDMLWLAGSANYLWPAALFAYILLPFADDMLRGKGRLPAAARPLLVLAALCFGNASENFSAAGIMLMGLIIIYQLARKRRVGVWLWLIEAAAVVGWLMLVLAPANSGRIGASGDGMLGALMERFVTACKMWSEHLSIVTVAYIALFCYARHNGADADRLAFSLALLVSALACNAAMTLSDYYPERALLGPVVLMIAACGAVAPAARVSLKPLWSALALSLCFFAALNIAQALPDNYNRCRLAQAREQAMIEARDAGETDAETFNIVGRSRYDAFYELNELTDAAEYSANVYYAKYFGLDSVVINRYEP